MVTEAASETNENLELSVQMEEVARVKDGVALAVVHGAKPTKQCENVPNLKKRPYVSFNSYLNANQIVTAARFSLLLLCSFAIVQAWFLESCTTSTKLITAVFDSAKHRGVFYKFYFARLVIDAEYTRS